MMLELHVYTSSTGLLKLKLKLKQTKQKISSCLSRNRRVLEICVVPRSSFISILRSLEFLFLLLQGKRKYFKAVLANTLTGSNVYYTFALFLLLQGKRKY